MVGYSSGVWESEEEMLGCLIWYGKAGVVGAGEMGRAIAQLLAESNFDVCLVDTLKGQLDNARNNIVNNLKMKKLDERIVDKITMTTDYSLLKGTELVIEAVPENQGIKQLVYATLDEILDPDTIIATNTSSMMVKDLANFVSKKRRANFLATHFFNDARDNPFLELARSEYTSNEVFEYVRHVTEDVLNKTVVESKDSTGFIANKHLMLYGALTMHDVAEQKVTIDEVDAVYRAFGHPLGLYQLLDFAGADIFMHVADIFREKLEDDDPSKPFYKLPAFINKMRERKQFGMKTNGCGFYTYGKDFKDIKNKISPSPNGDFVYTPVEETDLKTLKEAEDMQDFFKGVKHILFADDKAGRLARRYVLPSFVYALNLLSKEMGSVAAINTATRVGLNHKRGTLEIIDKIGIENLEVAIEMAVKENPDRKEFYGIDEGMHSELKKGTKLLCYGAWNKTPVGALTSEGVYEPYYLDIKVKTNKKDRVSVVVFNNPRKLNRLEKYNMDQLNDIWERLENDGITRSVLFTAEGKNMPIAGANIFEFIKGRFEPGKKLELLSEDEAERHSGRGQHLFEMIERSKLPTVGAFGMLLGGGAEFFYALDFRYLLASGFIEQPEVAKLGITTGYGGSYRLPNLIGLSKAKDILIAGERLDADMALDLKLVKHVYKSKEELLSDAYNFAKMLASISPDAIRLMKKKLYYCNYGIDNIEREAESVGQVFQTDNAREGIQAMLERRKPEFR